MTMLHRLLCTVVVFGISVFAVAPLASAEQSGHMPRIGVLWPSLVEQWDTAFRDGLREGGYVDGATAIVDVRATGGKLSSAEMMAEELIALGPDVIFAVPGVLAKAVVEAESRTGKPSW